jgi:glycosyltransferase involved in cell wall biosynthesis
MPRRVAIIERRLTHYRVPMYERLRQLLAERGIELTLLVGTAMPHELARQDGGHLPWATVIPTRYFLSGMICWQSFGRLLRGVDLAVVSHQNKLLHNHWLLCGPRRCKLAFWGHGRNMQSQAPNGLRERFRRWMISRVDWYFAYTQTVVDVVAETGFPPGRITNLNNAIDISGLGRDRDSVSSGEVARIKADLGLGGKPVGVFLGSLIAEKRLDFLLDACRRIRGHHPEFQLLVIGDGVERLKVREWAAAHDWVHWVGARLGRDKALYLACGDVILNPGMVGLGILDSFVFGLPMITTDCGMHSPEIAYLKSGENGLMTSDDAGEYAAAVSALLRDPEARQRMRQACLNSAGEYSLDNMAARFAGGIGTALASPRLH